MHILHAVWGEGSVFGPNPSTPPVLLVKKQPGECEEMGWWRDAEKLSRNIGESNEYIYRYPTQADWLEMLITDCRQLVGMMW